jgi:hypothetical protein
MTKSRGWVTSFALPLARSISYLTQRMGFVCELTTSVYVPAPSVSRFFCSEGIASKSLSFMGFTISERMKPA